MIANIINEDYINQVIKSFMTNLKNPLDYEKTYFPNSSKKVNIFISYINLIKFNNKL